MLSIFDGPALNRRLLLRAGGLALPAALAPGALPTALAGPGPRGAKGAGTGRSVIFLFQQGGPSQHETFDPKPDAPAGVRTLGGTVRTSLPGVHFGATMERLARLAHRFSIVRSFQTNNGGHNIVPIVGGDSLRANIGAHYSRLAGPVDGATGCPTNAVLFPAAVDPAAPKPEARGDLAATGDYGPAYAPFVVGGRGNLQADMNLNLPRERFFGDRRALLTALDRLARRADPGGGLAAADEAQRQAFALLGGGGVARALDLAREDPGTLARYDTTRYAQPGRWDRVSRGRKGYYSAQAASIGKLLLTARRLCEAGCGFVTVHAGYAGVWDMHADGNNLNMAEGMEAVGRSFDHAVAAFIEDCEARGLGERILLVATGEMGRTPKVNPRGGRDHWGRLAPLLVYGGGFPGGQVIGASDRWGGEPATAAHGPKHLISTLLNTVLDAGRVRLEAGVPNGVQDLLAAPGLTLER